MKRIIAKILKFLGFKPSYSHTICEQDSSGYGKLLTNGYWEYPLKP